VNRAQKALQVTGTEFGVGIEGDIMQLGERWYNLGFVAIIDKGWDEGNGNLRLV
jgi:non-canonical (house-cleaning) NTP pyrophosphatase